MVPPEDIQVLCRRAMVKKKNRACIIYVNQITCSEDLAGAKEAPQGGDGSAGDYPSAALIFYTHIRARAQGAGRRFFGHLDQGRRAQGSGEVNKHTLNVNRLAGAQTRWPSTSAQGRRN